MAIFRCKMCGAALNIQPGENIVKCEYCRVQQTIPRLDDDRRANLYDRANHFRRNNEFDKAMGIYEQILNEDLTDSEAYWSLVLCKYGIEYVEDPATGTRVPTVNRAQYTSVLADEDYRSAISNADPYQKEIYEREAKAIDEIQKGFLEISSKEEPFDVFICYKETDDRGRRTQDSVMAQELYYGLKNEGFKVFFARITLEDKLGSAYEPYIFAALNSAKVMVVLGTNPQNFNAVWVKNEWSRYLSLIKQGKKKVLIPAYRGMNPYDLPEEFSHLQAQDMEKLGFMQDLVRGIKKIIGKDKKEPVKETVVVNQAVTGPNITPLLKRAYIFLEDCAWESADEYAEKVLDSDPECSDAYMVKLLVDLKLPTLAALENYTKPFSDNPNFQKAVRFAEGEEKEKIVNYAQAVLERINSSVYDEACQLMDKEKYGRAAEMFATIKDYRDSAEKERECKELAVLAHKEQIYSDAMGMVTYSVNENTLKKAIEMLQSIRGYKDADEKIVAFEESLRAWQEKKAQEEQEIGESIKREEEFRKDRIYALYMVLAFAAIVVTAVLIYVSINLQRI